MFKFNQVHQKKTKLGSPMKKSSSSSNLRLNKRKPIGSRRTVMTNSRTQSGKKQDNKSSLKTSAVKTTQGSIIKKRKNPNNSRNNKKPL